MNNSYFRSWPCLALSIMLLFITVASHAQNYGDANNAYIICDLTDYYFEQLPDAGIQKENLHLKSSNIEETQSMWFKFEVEQEGLLEFLIVPHLPADDIDFILYRINEDGQYIIERASTSGETIGQNSEQCLGQTGLKQIASDISQSDGCHDAKNNFLAPCQLNANAQYLLFLNNYESKGGISILFEGSGGLKLKELCNPKPDQFEIMVYPNPASEEVYVTPNYAYDSSATLEIFSMSGKLMYQKNFETFSDKKSIDISNFIDGNYTIRLEYEDEIRIKTFIKQ